MADKSLLHSINSSRFRHITRFAFFINLGSIFQLGKMPTTGVSMYGAEWEDQMTQILIAFANCESPASSSVLEGMEGLPTASRRYSRLKVCATTMQVR